MLNKKKEQTVSKKVLLLESQLAEREKELMILNERLHKTEEKLTFTQRIGNLGSWEYDVEANKRPGHRICMRYSMLSLLKMVYQKIFF